MNDSTDQMTRRDCLAWIARASAVALAGSAAPGAQSAEGGAIKIANLMAIPCETAREIERPETILTRTSKGVACLSRVCTHRRNKLEVDSEGHISCPVHSSTFDLAGNPSGGPATRPLTWYQTAVSNNGAITVDVSQTVAQNSWAELPGWAKPKVK